MLGLTACKKDEKELDGAIPAASFTYTLDVSQFPVVVTFTNTSTDGFLYQWDFGDGSELASGKDVTHTYTLPRTYTVKLVVAGRGGTANAPTQDVTIPSICSNSKFNFLTDCGGTQKGSWTYSDLPGAIKRLGADGVTVLSASTAPLPECQADDQFSFTSSFGYLYDAGLNCTPGSNMSNAHSFTFRETGNVSQITLVGKKAFVGLTDSVQNKTYEVVEATAHRAAPTRHEPRRHQNRSDADASAVAPGTGRPPADRRLDAHLDAGQYGGRHHCGGQQCRAHCLLCRRDDGEPTALPGR